MNPILKGVHENNHFYTSLFDWPKSKKFRNNSEMNMKIKSVLTKLKGGGVVKYSSKNWFIFRITDESLLKYRNLSLKGEIVSLKKIHYDLIGKILKTNNFVLLLWIGSYPKITSRQTLVSRIDRIQRVYFPKSYLFKKFYLKSFKLNSSAWLYYKK